MYEPILAWTGFAVLLLLCLPLAGARRLILMVYGWALRLALLAALASGAVLWFRPDLLPSEVVGVLAAFPALGNILPSPGAPTFGLTAAALITAVFLPLLALLDAACRSERRAAARRPAETPRPAPVVVSEPAAPRALPQPAPAPRRPDRRAAAETMAEIGARKPFRVADHVS